MLWVVIFASCGDPPTGEDPPADTDTVVDGDTDTDADADSDTDTDDSGTELSGTGARWTWASPAGFRQLPQEDEAVVGALRFGLRGWEQTADASDGANTLAIVPRNGVHRPLAVLGEPVGTRSLLWFLTPFGHYWHNPVVWDDGTADASGRLLYYVLEGGVLDATWTDAPPGTTLTVELSGAPSFAGSDVHQLGAMRVRVVSGTGSLSGTVLTVTPIDGRVQLLVYEDPQLDVPAVDAAGALLDPLPGYVSESPNRVVERHLHFVSPVLGLDTVFAIDGTVAAAGPGPVFLGDAGQLWVGEATDTSGWRLLSLAVKIIKYGPVGMRRMSYYQAAPAAGSNVGGQTFNFYVFTPRGTVTLWTVGRVVEPYRLALFDGPPQVVLADFPATSNDYSEDLGGGTDVLSTRTGWAWDATTLIEGSRMVAEVPIAHTGREGNSIDGGWRHVITGGLSDFRIGDGDGFRAETVPTAAYDYDPGDAAQAVYAEFSAFHRLRSWTGAWSDRRDLVADLTLSDTLYFGCVKELHNTDELAAGEALEVNQVLHAAPGAPEDPAALYARYQLPDGIPLRDGMLDLDAGAVTTGAWDLGITGSEATIAWPL